MGEYFEVTEIDHDKKSVVVEDKELGIIFTVINLKGDWKSAEIHDNYSVKFLYEDQDPVIITFME